MVDPNHFIKLSKGARADIAAWLSFLETYNGISVFPQPDFTHSDTLNLYSDASGSLGFAAIFGAKWLQGHWHDSLRDENITTKELFPIVLVMEVWGHELSNKRVLFHTDNEAVATIINKQTCRNPTTMVLVRRFVVSALKNNVVFRAKHIPGKTNTIADLISRFQNPRALAPWLNPDPTPIPSKLLRLN